MQTLIDLLHAEGCSCVIRRGNGGAPGDEAVHAIEKGTIEHAK